MLNRKFLLTCLVLISSARTNSDAFAREVAECGVIYRGEFDKFDPNPLITQYVPTGRFQTVCTTQFFPEAVIYSRRIVSKGDPDWISAYEISVPGPRGTLKLATSVCISQTLVFNRKPEYGIEKFESCDIKKTTDELNEYIAQNKVSIANDGKDLLQFQSNFYSEEKNQIAMGCLISNYQSDAIYSGLTIELKTQFQNAFSIVFDSSAFTADVCAQPQASSIQLATCADSDTSTKCGNLRRYRDNLALLQAKKVEILDLKNDVVPRQNSAYAAELDGLVSLMPQEARN